jgi:hypothetical protein
MSACCGGARHRNAPTWARTVREIFSWGLPGAALVLVPKCPACLAAYVMLWTGISLSFTTATILRWSLLFACVASLLFLVVERGYRIVFRSLKKENDPCPIK